MLERKKNWNGEGYIIVKLIMALLFITLSYYSFVIH